MPRQVTDVYERAPAHLTEMPNKPEPSAATAVVEEDDRNAPEIDLDAPVGPHTGKPAAAPPAPQAAPKASKQSSSVPPSGPPNPGNPVVKVDLHPCGLPHGLMSKKAIKEYVAQYGYGANDVDKLEITDAERDSWNKAQKSLRAKDNRIGLKKFFVAALRLHNAGFALKKPDVRSLNDMKVVAPAVG